MIGREDEVRDYRLRARKINALVAVCFCLIGVRLFYLQILKGDELRKYSEANRLKKEKVFPTRGIIFDRLGRVLVDNRASYDAVVLSQYYKATAKMNARLAKVLEMEEAELELKLQKAKTQSFYPVLLKSDVSKDIIAAIEMDSEGFAGVDIEANVQRRYPYGEIAAQVFGYVGEVDKWELKRDTKKVLQFGDNIGKQGLERTFDSYLRGINGVGYVEVDAMGRRRKREQGEELLGFVAQTEPVPGDNLYLTIDLDLELVAVHAMQERNFSGAVIALDPRNGEVLVMASLPSYHPEKLSSREVDPKIWSHLSGSESGLALLNRAIQGVYPPGSTFKLLVAIAALTEGVASPHTMVNCTGFLPFGSRHFNCWRKHGNIDFITAIHQSCDVFFYTLGLQLGIDKLAKYARLFGLGERTEVERLSSEAMGLIPDSEWKQRIFKEIWYPGETLSVAIGQGAVTVTPLQLATVYAAIANGGFVYRPYIVKKIEGHQGEVIKEYQPMLKRNKIDIPTEVFEVVKEGLYRVVNEPGGTAYMSRSKAIVLSGKTGTSQIKSFTDITKKKCENMEPKDKHHAWFVGYAPRETPEIVVAVLAEHGCHGYIAGRIVKEIVEAHFEKKEVPELEQISADRESKAAPVERAVTGNTGVSNQQ